MKPDTRNNKLARKARKQPATKPIPTTKPQCRVCDRNLVCCSESAIRWSEMIAMHDFEVAMLEREIKRLKREAHKSKNRIVSCYAQGGRFISMQDYGKLDKSGRSHWKSWSTTEKCFLRNRLNMGV